MASSQISFRVQKAALAGGMHVYEFPAVSGVPVLVDAKTDEVNPRYIVPAFEDFAVIVHTVARVEVVVSCTGVPAVVTLVTP